MFQFLHPRPVVDRRPVAEHSIQVQVPALPVLTALNATEGDAAPQAPSQATAQVAADATTAGSVRQQRPALVVPPASVDLQVARREAFALEATALRQGP